MSTRYLWFVSALSWSSFSAAETQQFASLGDLNLSSGEVINDCQIGFRTYGKLNPARDNVVVMPTWHTGSTSDLKEYELIGPNKLLDTNRYFVITIDALGNGVSASPSNDKHQSGSDFPEVSIADMVYSQYRLLKEKLDIQSVHAVVGISMGGMQTFQWIRQYPEFMYKAAAIDGSPYLTSYDVIQWQTYLEQNASGSENFDSNNYLTQTQAMIDHDAFGTGTEQYENNLKSIVADLLVVYVPADHMVNPTPAKMLAASIGADLVDIQSNCGHMGTTCEDADVARVINPFRESEQTNRPGK
jgi:homoserine O-acetyltransferase